MTKKKQKVDELGDEYDLNGKSQDYWEGIIEGRKHKSSSPETRNKLDKIMEAHEKTSIGMAGLKAEMGGVKDAINLMRDAMKDLEKRFVTKAEFGPVKIVVYGIVGLILTAVVAGGLSFLIVKQSSGTTEEIVSRAIQNELSKYEVIIE